MGAHQNQPTSHRYQRPMQTDIPRLLDIKGRQRLRVIVGSGERTEDDRLHAIKRMRRESQNRQIGRRWLCRSLQPFDHFIKAARIKVSTIPHKASSCDLLNKVTHGRSKLNLILIQNAKHGQNNIISAGACEIFCCLNHVLQHLARPARIGSVYRKKEQHRSNKMNSDRPVYFVCFLKGLGRTSIESHDRMQDAPRIRGQPTVRCTYLITNAGSRPEHFRFQRRQKNLEISHGPES